MMTNEEMREANPEVYLRATKLAALQKAMYHSFVDLYLTDHEIIVLLTNSLVEMAEARGMTAPELNKEITRCRELRALVKGDAQGTVQ